MSTWYYEMESVTMAAKKISMGEASSMAVISAYCIENGHSYQVCGELWMRGEGGGLAIHAFCTKCGDLIKLEAK